MLRELARSCARARAAPASYAVYSAIAANPRCSIEPARCYAFRWRAGGELQRSTRGGQRPTPGFSTGCSSAASTNAVALRRRSSPGYTASRRRWSRRGCYGSPGTAMSSRPQRGGADLWVRVGQLTSVAYEFLGSILAGALLGYFFDRQFETAPWGLIALTLLGTTTGLYRMVVTLRQPRGTRMSRHGFYCSRYPHRAARDREPCLRAFGWPLREYARRRTDRLLRDVLGRRPVHHRAGRKPWRSCSAA
jgi:hypothetical protein